MKQINNLKFAGLAALAIVAVTLLLQTQPTQADGQGQRGGGANRNVHVTFTKYVVDYPSCGVLANMAGVVGGDVGDGTYTGELLFQSVVGEVWKGEALYHFHGPTHSFTALVHVEQTGLHAVITGVVTDGWLKGHAVKGEYTQINCGQSGPDFPNCYEGALNIKNDPND